MKTSAAYSALIGLPYPPKSQSDPGHYSCLQFVNTSTFSGYPTVSVPSTTDRSSRNQLPECIYSDALLDPNTVVKALTTNVSYDTVGRVGVSLARYLFFGDDILRVSTLKGKGKKHMALNPHKLEALNAFIHQLDPFKSLSKDQFDANVKTRVERALKDHLKSATNRSPLPNTFK